MPYFDLPLEKLRKYRSPEKEPADFDRFWAQTLQEARQYSLAARFEPINDRIYRSVEVFDVTFNGYGGQPIKGWLLLPTGADGRLPCLVSYIGYGGGRSLPIDHLAPAVAGFAHFVMDTRGQGSSWSPGDTPDYAEPQANSPQYPGFMTRGIDSPQTYYYRRVFTDAVRAVEAAAEHPKVDRQRIGVMGGSQGGGIAIAAAGLLGRAVKLCMPDVPFLCHYRRAMTLVDSYPYQEIVQYLKIHRDRVEQVFRTLAYFDGVHFARRIRARCLFSVGLMDMTCPPSTVFAAYNEVRAPKEMRIYDFNTHEGGGVFQAVERLRFAARYL